MAVTFNKVTAICEICYTRFMSELEKRFHRVMGSMTGNESLVASLDNDAAGELLMWGEIAVRRIVSTTDGMDDDAADELMAPQLRALRLMIRAIGRWVGEAQVLDEESKLALWKRVEDQARVLFGDVFVLPPMNDVLAQLPADVGAVQVVTWLKNLIEEKGMNI